MKRTMLALAILVCLLPWTVSAEGNFSSNGNGTVTDHETGLMWQQGYSESTMGWPGALAYCEDLDLASYTDWRLPNIKELQSIVDHSRIHPSINMSYFNSPPISSMYWSSSSVVQNPAITWCVDFYSSGRGYMGDKDWDLGYARCVRGGL